MRARRPPVATSRQRQTAASRSLRLCRGWPSRPSWRHAECVRWDNRGRTHRWCPRRRTVARRRQGGRHAYVDMVTILMPRRVAQLSHTRRSEAVHKYDVSMGISDDDVEGWYLDPYGIHEARWFSDGTPTFLVRDGHQEAHDAPPPGPPPAPRRSVGRPDGRNGGRWFRRSEALVEARRACTTIRLAWAIERGCTPCVPAAFRFKGISLTLGMNVTDRVVNGAQNRCTEGNQPQAAGPTGLFWQVRAVHESKRIALNVGVRGIFAG